MRKSLKTYFALVILILPVICIVLFAFLFFSQIFKYRLFMLHSQGYYAKVANACDLILINHPVTSNDVVRYSSMEKVPFAKRISGDDPSLPKIVLRLHPDWVLIGTNFVSISIPPERMGGFGISWEQDELSSNKWYLQVDADGELETIYTRTGPHLQEK